MLRCSPRECSRMRKALMPLYCSSSILPLAFCKARQALRVKNQRRSNGAHSRHTGGQHQPNLVQLAPFYISFLLYGAHKRTQAHTSCTHPVIAPSQRSCRSAQKTALPTAPASGCPSRCVFQMPLGVGLGTRSAAHPLTGSPTRPPRPPPPAGPRGAARRAALAP